jgi:RNA polymerase sigma factor (sigma-70 family)
MTTQIDKVLQHLRRSGLLFDAGQLTDGQLLERFIRRRERAALEALVRRHSSMVWGVCRRVLRNHHDVEDAFQATFLVLVRKPASISPREMVGNWLYGVAHQTALKARATAAKLRARQKPLRDQPEPAERERDCSSDLLPLLDQELSRLPAKYRVAVVLCDLEGKTRREAARQLGVPEGTLGARVARARALLAKRLARRGVLLSGGSLAIVLAESASACAPTAAVVSTIQTAAAIAAGQAAAGAASAHAVALSNGVLKAMMLTKLKLAACLCVAAVLVFLGTGWNSHAPAADKPATSEDRLRDTLQVLDKQWWEAASKYDVDTIGKILADDWVAVNPKGPDWTKARYLERCRQSRFVDVRFVTERRVVRVDKHSAIMTYEVYWRGQEKSGTLHDWAHDRMVSCWVQRDGGWFVKYTECVNLPVPAGGPPAPAAPAKSAYQLTARASSSWDAHVPEVAFDGKGINYWNSGGAAPAWIEADLGVAAPVASIRLVAVQDIPGPTTHEVWVSDEPIGDDRTKARLMYTFKGDTRNTQSLEFYFPKDASARYVQVRTTESPTWIAWGLVEIRVWEDGQRRLVPLKPQSEPKRPTDDWKGLEGVWQVVAVEVEGKDIPLPRKDPLREDPLLERQWVVKDRRITLQPQDLYPSAESQVFTLRPDKSPKEIDIIYYPVSAYEAADVSSGIYTLKGIYTLDGDVWKVCLAAPAGTVKESEKKPRPTKMATKKGSGTILMTLKRVK